MHIAIELPWSDSGWEGRICDDPEMNGPCRAWKNARAGIDLQLEQDMHGEAWKLTKDRTGSNRNYRLPCWSFVNTFGSREIPFYPEVHANIYTQRKKGRLLFKFQRVRGYALPPYSTACAPWLQMLNREKSKGKWLNDPPQETKRLHQFWAQFRSDHDFVFFFCRKGHPYESRLGILPVGVCLLRAINKIGKGVHPSSRAHEPFPIWEHAVTHGFPTHGFRIPWQRLDQRSMETALELVKSPPFSVIPIQHPVTAMSSVELFPWMKALCRVANGMALPSASGSASWLEKASEVVHKTREHYPSLGTILDVLNNANPFAVAAQAEHAKMEGSQDPWASLGVGSMPRDQLGVLLSQFILGDEQVWRLMQDDDALPNRLSRLRENPYWLCDRGTARIWGIGDAVAPAAIDVIRDDRVKGKFATIWRDPDSASAFGHALAALNLAAVEGNSYLPLGKIARTLDKQQRLLGLLATIPDGESPIVVGTSKLEGRVVALRSEHAREVELAESLWRLTTNPRPLTNDRGVAVPSFRFGDIEIETRGVTVVTGPAGTGKSTVISKLVAFLKSNGLKPTVVTPTGRAAKVLARAGIKGAQTLHLFLAQKGWIKQEEFETFGTPIRTSCLVVDEASMLSNEQLLTLLRATRTAGLRFLCLVGDANQLEPINVGRPFSVIDEWVKWLFPKRHHWLDTIHRRGADNLLAKAIQQPEFAAELSRLLRRHSSLTSEVRLDKTVYVLRWNTKDELVAALGHAISAEVDRSGTAVDFKKTRPDYALPLQTLLNPYELPADETALAPGVDSELPAECSIYSWQIICPRRFSGSGVETMNVLAQKLLSGGDGRHERPSRRYFGRINRGDKVIWKANRKVSLIGHKGQPMGQGFVVNGAIGIVRAPKGVTGRENTFVLSDDLHGRCVSVPFSELDRYVELGYATTVHKAQGSGFHTVILVLDSREGLLDKRMLYTAVTRHVSRLFVLLRVPDGRTNSAGALAPLARGEALKDRKRNTMLRELLESKDAASHRQA